MTLASKAIDTIKNWWWFIIKGILFFIAGIVIFSRPVEGYVGLSVLFSLIMLGTGVSQLAFSISNKAWRLGWGWTLVSGIIDVVVGFFLLLFPVITMATLPFLIGFWLMFCSFYIMGASMDFNNYDIPGWGWLLAGGVLLLILSVLILYYPAASIVGIVTCSGAAFLTAGILCIGIAFKLKGIKKAARNFV